MISRFLLFLSVVFLGIGQMAWGQYTGTGTFTKITSVGELTDGYYVVTNETDAFAMNNTHTTFFGHTAVTPSSGELMNPDASIVWKIETNGSGKTIYNEVIEKYVGWISGNAASAEDAPADTNRWTFSYAESKWTVNNVDTPVRQLSYNWNSPRFAAYGNNNQQELQLYKLGEIPTDPVLNASETEITGLGYMEGNTPASQSFSLNGLNLDPANGNITVTAPANFQVSTDDVSFNNSLNIAYTDGALAATDIYVRLNGGLTLGNYNGDITISGGSANATVSVEGIVTEFSTICGEEDFENIPTNNSGSYQTRTWTGNNGIEWTVNDSRTDQTITGKAIGLRNSTLTTTSPVAGGVGTLSFDYKRTFSGNSTLKVFVNGTQYGGDISVTSETPANFSVDVNIEGDVTIELVNSGNRIAVDNLNWTCHSSTPQAPVITSPLTHSSEYGAAATYTITADYLPTSFNATDLPAGLSINTSTGEISGTVTADVGNYNINISATNDEGTDTETLVWTVTPKALTITGLTVNNKVYDGNTTASLGGSPTLNGIVNSDVVNLGGTPTANFNTKNVGNNKAVTVSGYTISGADAGNYTLTQPTGLQGNITAKNLTVTGAVAQNKTYDGTTTATITGSTLQGVIPPDVVTVSGGGTFNNANAGIGKPVTSALTLSGTDAGNYNLTQPTGLTADITKIAPIITPASINVNVGGNYLLPGGITSTSNGVLTFSMTDNAHATLTGTTINGIGVGSNTLTINQAEGTNHLSGTASVTVYVAEITYSHGDFRTKTAGKWSYHTTPPADITQWQRFNSTTNSWDDFEGQPNTSPEYTAYITKNTEIPTNATGHGRAKIIVMKDPDTNIASTLTFSPSANWTFRGIKIDEGSTIIMNTVGLYILSERDFEIMDGGNFIFNFSSTSASTLTSSLWQGVEKFHPNSNFIVQNHDTGGGNYFLPPAISLTSNTFNGVTAYFGNLIFDATVKDIRLTTTNLSGSYLTHGNFELRPNSIGAGSQTLFYGNGNWTIGKDLIIGQNTHNTGNANINLTTGANTIVLNVKGNFINNSSNTLTFTSNTSADTTLNLKGDLIIGNDGKLISQSSTDANLNFSGTGDGLTPETTQTIDVANSSTASNIAFNVNSGAYVQLVNQNLALGGGSSFTVKNEGVFDFGFSGSNALNITNHVNSANFTTEPGSTIKITSPDGITTSTGSGNVQTMTTGRTYNPAGIYHYIGKENQVTGNAVATTSNPLTGKIIVELENATSEFNASASRTINGTGTLEIRKGIVNDSSTNGFIGTGNLLMESDLGRYITSRTGTQPELQGTYTLTAGTIEFANTSTSALIRVTPIYHNIDISGTNILSGGKDLVVNNLTKVTATGKLTIPSATDSESPYVLTARNGIQVTLGGTAHFLNNAQLLQDVGAVNSGNIIMDRFVEDMDNQMSTQMDYVYWSSPVSPQVLQSFSPGSQYVLRYNESNDLFYYVNFGTEPNFILGKGYAFSAEVDTEHPVNPTGYDETYSFTGTPHNGNIAFNDLRKNSANSQGFNLVGNPYPSNIDADKLFAANNSSIYATVLFWTNSVDYTPTQQGSDYSGNNYAIYNKTGGNPATDYGNAFEIPNGIIKTGQGFMVQKKEVGTGPLVFNNDMRTTTNGTFYQKSGLVDKDRFWLTMTTYQGVVNTTLIGYIPGATNDFEQDYDAELMGGSDAVYTILGDKNLSIQGREYPFNTNEVIPLGLRFYQTGKFIIDIKDKEGIFDGSQRIYLKDKYLNKTHILSQSYYEFESHEGEYNDRFELFFRPSFSTSVENPAWTIITQKQKDIFIYTSEDIIKDVEIVNLFGWPVYRQSNVNATELRIPSQSLGKQILVVKVKTESGKIETKKIINK